MQYYKEIMDVMTSVENYFNNKNNILPSEVYNEGWMLRLILKWFSDKRKSGYPLSFNKDAVWFSEGMLEAISVKSKSKYVKPDAIIGNICIGKHGVLNNKNCAKANAYFDIRPQFNCSQFIAIEAKMNSSLNKNTVNGIKINQVTKYVIGMSYVLHQSKVKAGNIDDLAFYLLFPAENKKGEFEKSINRDNIKDNVKLLVESSHNDYINEWYENGFIPFMDHLKTGLITWEEILKFICEFDHDAYEILNTFYTKCKCYKIEGIDLDLL